MSTGFSWNKKVKLHQTWQPHDDKKTQEEANQANLINTWCGHHLSLKCTTGHSATQNTGVTDNINDNSILFKCPSNL